MKQSIKKYSANLLIIFFIFSACITIYTRIISIPVYSLSTTTNEDSTYYATILNYLNTCGIKLKNEIDEAGTMRGINQINIAKAGVDILIGDFISSEYNVNSLGREQIYNDVILNATFDTLQSGSPLVINSGTTFFPNFFNYLKSKTMDWLNGDYGIKTINTLYDSVNNINVPVCTGTYSSGGFSNFVFNGFIKTPYTQVSNYYLNNNSGEIDNFTLFGQTIICHIQGSYNAYYYRNSWATNNKLVLAWTKGSDGFNYSGLYGLCLFQNTNDNYMLVAYNPFTDTIGSSIAFSIYQPTSETASLNITSNGYVPSYTDTLTSTPINNTTDEPITDFNDLITDIVNNEVDTPTNTGGGGTGGSDTNGTGIGGFLENALDFITGILNAIKNTILDLFTNIAENLTLPELKNKFPFSIPYDLISFFSILNATPQTPELNGSINLGIYTWNIDWDLHQFDNTATLCRNLEFIAFAIGLILATRNLIK